MLGVFATNVSKGNFLAEAAVCRYSKVCAQSLALGMVPYLSSGLHKIGERKKFRAEKLN